MAITVILMERAAGVGDGSPLRIPCARISDIGGDVTVELDASETRALGWED